MALYKIQNVFHSTTGLPEDDVINTFHFDTTEGACTSAVGHALNGHVAAAYNIPLAGGVAPAAQWLARSVRIGSAPTVKAYDGEDGGSPIAIDTWAGFASGLDTNDYPNEVSVCLSYSGDLTGVAEEMPDGGDLGLAPDRPASRRRGRIYFGPLSPSAGGGVPARPQSGVINSLNKMGQFLGNPTDPTLTAVDAIWVVYSKVPGVDAIATRIESCWVDDEFDTQRRRGHRATVRTTVSV